jgi:putative membrane protein
MRRSIGILLTVYALASAAIVTVGLLGGRVPPTVTTLMTVLAFTFALLHGSVRLGWGRTLLLVGLTFGISLLFESVGVATGLIYGPYHYTDRLGPMFLGLVPYLIPLAWFMMMYPSFIIAVRIVPAGWTSWKRGLAVAAVGGLAMTAWDLAMDPFMVKAGHWTWEVQGAYFGVPLQNYWGWWLTAFITLSLFIFLSKPLQLFTTDESDRSFDRLPIYAYAINCLSGMLTDLTLGLDGPALVGLFAMLPWILLAVFSTF